MQTKSIGQIIYESRKNKSLTRKELSAQLNVSQKMISKWEKDIEQPDVNATAKLSAVLGIPEETLMHIPLDYNNTNPHLLPEYDIANYSTANIPNNSDFDTGHDIYQNNVHHLLKIGLLGFIIGFLLAFIVTSEDELSYRLAMSCAVSLFFSGVPYGWELLTKLIGKWIVIGSFPVMFIVFIFKFVATFYIGWVAYPIALLYNLAKAQPKGSKLKFLFIFLLIVFIGLIVAFFIWISFLNAQGK